MSHANWPAAVLGMLMVAWIIWRFYWLGYEHAEDDYGVGDLLRNVRAANAQACGCGQCREKAQRRAA